MDFSFFVKALFDQSIGKLWGIISSKGNAVKFYLFRGNHIKRYSSVPVISLDNDAVPLLYCATCMEKEKKLYQMVYDGRYWTCMKCNKGFSDSMVKNAIGEGYQSFCGTN